MAVVIVLKQSQTAQDKTVIQYNLTCFFSPSNYVILLEHGARLLSKLEQHFILLCYIYLLRKYLVKLHPIVQNQDLADHVLVGHISSSVS